MSTAHPQPTPQEDQPNQDANTTKPGKNIGCGCGFALLLFILLMMIFGGGDDESTDNATETEQESSSTFAQPTSSEAPAANVAEGVDPEMGPQEWFDEAVYRANNCASQNLAFGGVPMCAIRGVNTEKGGTMLVGYIDQDEPGVQEHFEPEQRRSMMVQAFAERVGQAKFDGDPRVQHVTQVRIIASGGKGIGSGWQDETEVK